VKNKNERPKNNGVGKERLSFCCLGKETYGASGRFVFEKTGGGRGRGEPKWGGRGRRKREAVKGGPGTVVAVSGGGGLGCHAREMTADDCTLRRGGTWCAEGPGGRKGRKRLFGCPTAVRPY